MKFVLAVHGSRGDVEPCTAVGVELVRRGHEVRMAVPPNLIGFVESAGLAAVTYGPDSSEQVKAAANLTRQVSKIQNPTGLLRAGKELFTEGWAEMSRTLTGLAGGADLMLTGGQVYHGVAANVAEYYDIPLAALHYFPVRLNGQVALPSVPLPAPLTRSIFRVAWWLYWQITKGADDAQRRELGLSRAECPAERRVLERGTLEIQAYDELCFPGLAAEWSGLRPFVGAVTMELGTDADDEVASWISAGTPPIYFGFGSQPIESPADTLAMIGAACAELGERALICSGWAEFDHAAQFDHVKLVRAVSHAAIFPACRAVVHHGGAGTTAAGMRAGTPALILWNQSDEPIWAAHVKRLKVGSARRFSTITRKSLVKELRSILAPGYANRAREIASQMTKPAVSVAITADLLEGAALGRNAGPGTFNATAKRG